MHQQFQNMNKQPGQDGRPPNQGSQGFGGQNGQRSTANPTSHSGSGFGGQSGQPKSPNPTGSKIGEYIDFEEVK
jgi:hypothetical protein